jgi:hypothetical protein
MKNVFPWKGGRLNETDAIQQQISAYLYDVYTIDSGLLGDLDRWTQRRITDENMAKLALVMESGDPAETCYRDLIREIDSEAENGVFLVDRSSHLEHLHELADNTGISGKLRSEMHIISPVLFPDETRRSRNNLDLVWVTIRAYHDRAHVDAKVSEILLGHLMGDADQAADIATAMRELMYAHHEDNIRRCCELPRILDDKESRMINIMTTELVRRSGDYGIRTDDIRSSAEAH